MHPCDKFHLAEDSIEDLCKVSIVINYNVKEPKMYKQDARCNVMVVDVPLHITRLEVKANDKNVDHNAIDE